MKLSRYSILFNKIPRLKEITRNRVLNDEDLECIENIHNFYKNPNINLKPELRKFFKTKREMISELELKTKSDILNNKIIDLQQFKNAKTVFCYISFNKEIDTFNILNYCINNKNLCVPVIKNKIMIPCKITDITNMVRNKYGILEPINLEEIKIDNIDLAIVPALGFNSLGYRIGYGGGFYDKFLKKFKGFSIGMTLKNFMTTKLIPEKFDQPVNKIITL